MRAVVFHGPGQKHWEEVPDPKIVENSDAIVRITSTTICGTDLHILKGDVPAMTPGRILGHEAVGTVTEIGLGREVRRQRRGHTRAGPCRDRPADRRSWRRRGRGGGRDPGDLGAVHRAHPAGWPGGVNVGVHGKPATLHLESPWIKGVTITTGLVDTFSTPTLLKSVTAGQIDPTRFTTHRFPLHEAIQAYDTFARPGETNALKVLLTAQG